MEREIEKQALRDLREQQKQKQSTTRHHHQPLSTNTNLLNVSSSHSCDYCGKLFANRNNLVNHTRTHTNERPYKCDICEKTFKRNHHLTDHQLVHAPKKFNCSLCMQSFRTQRSLDSHMTTNKHRQNARLI